MIFLVRQAYNHPLILCTQQSAPLCLSLMEVKEKNGREREYDEGERADKKKGTRALQACVERGLYSPSSSSSVSLPLSTSSCPWSAAPLAKPLVPPLKSALILSYVVAIESAAAGGVLL